LDSFEDEEKEIKIRQKIIVYFHVHAVMIRHRDECNAECENDTAPFMVKLFIMRIKKLLRPKVPNSVLFLILMG